jgi:hypothetical protein
VLDCNCTTGSIGNIMRQIRVTNGQDIGACNEQGATTTIDSSIIAYRAVGDMIGRVCFKVECTTFDLCSIIAINNRQ